MEGGREADPEMCPTSGSDLQWWRAIRFTVGKAPKDKTQDLTKGIPFNASWGFFNVLHALAIWCLASARNNITRGSPS